MARQLRVQYPGAIYHVTVRGNAQGDIYLDDQDRRIFLARLEESAAMHAVRVYLYCLMTNHFHLVVETPKANLGRFMHSLLTGYTVYFNLRHRRHGHLTQGRYGAKLVAGDSYLLNLSRYVHLNPVKVKAVAAQPLVARLKHLREYPWSSCRGYMGASPQQKWMAYGPLAALLGGRGRERAERYRRFVESAVDAGDDGFKTELMRSPRSIGDDKFRAWVDEQYAGLVAGRHRPEDVSFRRMDQPVTVEAVLGAVCRVAGVCEEDLKARRRDWTWRSIAAQLLCKHAGLTRRECADSLGLGSGAAVSYHVRQAECAILQDKALGVQVAKIEKRLAAR
jgi:putative transposase